MKGISRFLVFFMLCCALPQSACVILSGKSHEPGREESRYDDASIKTAISSALLRHDAARANDLNVHCFRGHVFLVGEADKDFAAKAVDIAGQTQSVVHVTSHWFPQGTADTVADAAIEDEIAKRLLFTGDISTRRVDVDVWGGNVVLTGLAGSQEEIQNAVAAIRRMPAVKSVTSYLSPL